jgi:hypothetical protein
MDANERLTKTDVAWMGLAYLVLAVVLAWICC